MEKPISVTFIVPKDKSRWLELEVKKYGGDDIVIQQAYLIDDLAHMSDSFQTLTANISGVDLKYFEIKYPGIFYTYN